MTMIHRRTLLSAMAAGTGLLAVPTRLRAQTVKWPTSTVKIIAPVPAGGGVDIFCRKLAEQLTQQLGTTVIVDNKAGAAGLIGAKAVAAAPADGATFGYLYSGMVLLQAMGGKLDMQKQFTPIVGRIQSSTYLVVVHPDSPYKTLDDLFKAMATSPDKLSYGSGGNGSPAHIIFEKLKLAVPGINALHVPFKGVIEAFNALQGKNLDFVLGLTSSVIAQVSTGALRALAIVADKRTPLLPAVPTMAEAGVQNFSYSSWGGIFGPAGLPVALRDSLRSEIYKIMARPDFESFVVKSGADVMPQESPEAFEAFLKSSLESDTQLMAKLGLRS
ncbi:MAG: tripartite tricarboxylate transporter substrate binding protein [Pseudomonadota bacterium]